VPAREFTCKIVSVKWLTSTVIDLRFEPSRKFRFDPGQFLSVVVPPPPGAPKALRRAYSLALPHEEGYGLCVRVLPDGVGSNYLANLKAGDKFRAFAPYGEFLFDYESPRAACFVSTGTGLAPFIAMMRSKRFRENLPPRAINLFGARDQRDIIMPGEFRSLGVEEVTCLSEPKAGWTGFTGRVTDFLAQQGGDFPWQQMDFYLCGSGPMVHDVRNILRGKGVPDSHVHKEIYFVAPDRLRKPGQPQAVAQPGPLPPYTQQQGATIKRITPPPMRHPLKKVG
jgi:ferredoxin-NADP reductase